MWTKDYVDSVRYGADGIFREGAVDTGSSCGGAGPKRRNEDLDAAAFAPVARWRHADFAPDAWPSAEARTIPCAQCLLPTTNELD